jgi:hypothetical protein
MANLYYQNTFTAAASMNTDITLLGESNNALSPDQTIQVSVSVAELNDILKYSSQWTAGYGPTGASGEQPLPNPTVNFHDVAVSARAVALQNLFKAPGPTGSAAPTMTDDSGDATLRTLQNYFVNESFAWSETAENSAITDDVLNAIPAENVTSVDIQAITCETLQDVLPGAAGAGADVPDAAPNNGMDYARDLFEQAVAAGKVPGGGSTAFLAEDSVTVYVTYNLVKSKTFLLDSVQGSGTAKFRIAGTNIEVPNATVLSGTATKTIAWQFKAVA